MSRVRTGGRSEALAHLGKAREFLDAARAALDAGWHNAAASSAVSAGVNAKDSTSGRAAAADDRRSVAATDARAAVRRAATW